MKLRLFRPRWQGRCDSYRCNRPAAWYLGDPDGPTHAIARFCDECVRDLLANVPGELIDALPARATHPEEKPNDPGEEQAAEAVLHECAACGAVFSDREELHDHWAAEHERSQEETPAAEAGDGETVPPGAEFEVPAPVPPPYVCEDCGAEFETQRALNGHRTAKHLRSREAEG